MVHVFWPLDNFYYVGKVKSILDDGRHAIHYDGNDEETLQMVQENWHFDHLLDGNAIQFVGVLKSNQQEVLRKMMKILGQKPFLNNHAHVFEQAVMVKAFKANEGK